MLARDIDVPPELTSGSEDVLFCLRALMRLLNRCVKPGH